MYCEVDQMDLLNQLACLFLHCIRERKVVKADTQFLTLPFTHPTLLS